MNVIPKFCSTCSHPLKEKFVAEENRERLVCEGCSTIHYLNPRIVSGVIAKQEGKIILLRRGIGPALGAWTYPAGFVELGETVAESAVRETFEETGLEVRLGKIVGVYSYPDSHVAVVVYEAEVIGGSFKICREAMEIKSFLPEDIPWGELAFKSTRDAIKDWVQK